MTENVSVPSVPADSARKSAMNRATSNSLN
jgi:hypothetical protein